MIHESRTHSTTCQKRRKTRAIKKMGSETRIDFESTVINANMENTSDD
jgi:hypothetical protein